MKKLSPIIRPAVVLASTLALGACSYINQVTGETDSVDYKSTVSGDPLVIPPDLTQAHTNTRYVAPEGVARLSDFNAGQFRDQNLSPAERILPQATGMQVMRDGLVRWLVVERPAEDIYPQLIEFWGDQGFTIHTQNARAGIIETDWAENRAKIPEGWLRSALGTVLDQVFDSGERDRFTTRLERTASGHTEVYVSHQHMEETPSADGTGWKWVFGAEDQGLNAAMLARMMVYLGADQQMTAQQIRAATERDEAAASVSLEQGSLVLSEPFDRAWRRVGVAIDSARFTVEDRNRDQGDYYIRYLDTDTGEQIEQQTFFGRIFGTRNNAEPLHLRVHLAQQGASTTISVLDNEGAQLTDATAQRVLAVLAKNLRASL